MKYSYDYTELIEEIEKLSDDELIDAIEYIILNYEKY